MSQGPATAYAALQKELAPILRRYQVGNDVTVSAYMVARLALLEVRAVRGSEKAAELAYKLADELSTSGGPGDRL